MMGSGVGWAVLLVMPDVLVVVLAAVIAFVVILVRGITGAPRLPPGRGALEILNERFAHGEIDKQEFDERRRVLGG
jgi:putative membrane protein